MDNFHCATATLKLKWKTDCVGTLHLNRKYVPKVVKDKKLRKETASSPTSSSQSNKRNATQHIIPVKHKR
jgi:hypothetical protein